MSSVNLPVNRSPWFAECISRLCDNQNLNEQQITAAFDALTQGNFHPVEAGAFLVALRQKGETGEELAAAVRLLRTKALKLSTERSPVLDTCGTGGDHSGTFNISTAVAFILAGCDVCVVKHGNRAVSSLSGSSDVLQVLGVPIEAGVAWAQQCLNEQGLAFCYAPHFHPALAHIGPIRRQLGIRTTFNLLGPLLNPAGAQYQLIGVGPKIPLPELAKAAQLLGTTRTALVRGHDGLDEITLEGPTDVLMVTADTIEAGTLKPEDFGLPITPKNQILAGNAHESAQIILDVFAGKDHPALHYVLANAAFALHLIDPKLSLPDAVSRCREAIQSQAVWRMYRKLTEIRPELAPPP